MTSKELARKSKPRIDVGYSSKLGIQLYGEDNLYPDIVRQIIHASAIGTGCVNRYASFIEGNGIADTEAAMTKVNRNGETLDAIQRKISRDLATYSGFALHIGYNIFGDACEVRHVPFECCRLSEPDDNGIVAKVCVHPDWSGRLKRGGNLVKVDAKNIQFVDKYSPIREVVLSQMEACGGPEYYKGQILYFSMDGEMVYPISRADCVLTEMSTDEGISNIKHRNVRNNFFPAGMLITRRGQEADGEMFSDEFVKLQTDTQCVKILEVTIENEDDKPEFVPIKGTNYDKDFAVTEESTAKRIFTAYEQDAWWCIREGKLGFSGTAIADAFSVYNSSIAPYQRIVTRALDQVFAHWYEPITADFTIEPLQYIANGTPVTTE